MEGRRSVLGRESEPVPRQARRNAQDVGVHLSIGMMIKRLRTTFAWASITGRNTASLHRGGELHADQKYTT